MLKKLLLMSVWLCCLPALAQSVFEVTLASPPDDREQARAQALDIVLARLSGAEARDSWVQDEVRQDMTPYLESESASPGYRAVFNQSALQALLSSARLPFVTAPKPPILVWLSEQGQGRNQADSAWQTASAQFQQPLLWPLWDLDDHQALDARAAAFDHAALRAASQRYGADYWLALVEPGATPVDVLHWQLFSTRQTQPLLAGKLALNARSPADGITELLAAINQYWIAHSSLLKPSQLASLPSASSQAEPAEPLAMTADAPGELTIRVSDLRQFADAVLLERALAGLAGVQSVSVLDSAGAQSRYRLKITVSRAAVLQALTTVSALSPSGERSFSWAGS